MAEDVLTMGAGLSGTVHAYIVGRHFNGSMMDLRMFMKDTHCETTGEISGDTNGKPQCLLNCVVQQD